MPLLHRLACFRDDVIFVIYLYQMRMYKVDKTRVNEFGQGGDEEELDAKLAADPLKAPAGAGVVEEVSVGDASGEAEGRSVDGVAEPIKATGIGSATGGRRRK